MIYHTLGKHANHYTTDEHMMVEHVFIGGVMVSMFGSSMVDHVFIGGLMVSMFTSRMVEHVFIDGVMVSMLAKHANHYTIDEHMIYHT
jgi:hypothetical protein